MGAVQLDQLEDAEKMYEASGRCTYTGLRVEPEIESICVSR